MFSVALFQPEIPHNTGNISRLCVGTGCSLHLVKPLGFSLEDKYMKRCGLDHWPYLNLTLYENLDELVATGKRMALFSKRGKKLFWDHEFQPDDLLIFGRETKGLPVEFTDKYADITYALPMYGPARALNLANSVAAVVYEGLRQLQNHPDCLPTRRTFDADDNIESFDLATVQPKGLVHG